MAIHSRSFDEADERRTPDKTNVDVVKFPGATVARITFQPGWRWSDCIKPVVGGDSCQVLHVGTLLSGEMEVVHDDGSKARLVPGNAYVIEPGHDAWVVGDEPVVSLEFEKHAAETYAKA
ncbi:MAG TPA: cupin domain-containing protein [Nocardioidaceae bacterium]|nr:cupin domain-containing protein [Nocardioidaceae bacterium]